MELKNLSLVELKFNELTEVERGHIVEVLSLSAALRYAY